MSHWHVSSSFSRSFSIVEEGEWCFMFLRRCLSLFFPFPRGAGISLTAPRWLDRPLPPHFIAEAILAALWLRSYLLHEPLSVFSVAAFFLLSL